MENKFAFVITVYYIYQYIGKCYTARPALTPHVWMCEQMC